MTRAPAELLARIPTLTEVVEPVPLPDLGEDPVDRAGPAKAVEPALQVPDAWVEQLMARLGPQMDALVSSRLRDMLTPAIQDAVDEALDRLREPLVASVQAQLRDLLELELRRGFRQYGLQQPQSAESATTPDSGARLRIP